MSEAEFAAVRASRDAHEGASAFAQKRAHVGGRVMSVLDLHRLDERVAIVTGAGSGLGAAFAVALAEAGADVVLAARRADRLASTAASVEAAGRRALVAPTDVAEPDQCGKLADQAIEELGRIDVLDNNAGLGTAVPALGECPEISVGSSTSPDGRLLDGPGVRA